MSTIDTALPYNSTLAMGSLPISTSRLSARHRDAILLSFFFEADSRRLLHALSIAEYLEAWLTAPYRDEKLTVESLTPESLRIELLRRKGPPARVHHSIHILGPARICYAWSLFSPAGIVEAPVELRLTSFAHGCVVGLRQSGFRSAEENAWHCALWSRSMEKLRGLMQPH